MDLRLPRVHLTVGALPFAVAVVAGNLWAVSHFWEMSTKTVGATEYSVLAVWCGLLPVARCFGVQSCRITDFVTS
jgi:hypothetical protein